jgi:hypothetical protein
VLRETRNDEQATSNGRDSGTITRALIGAGLAVVPLLGCDNERPTRENSGPTKAAGGDGMERRPLGTRKLGALDVSALGHGCMSISANYGPPADRSQGINVMLAQKPWIVPIPGTRNIDHPD